MKKNTILAALAAAIILPLILVSGCSKKSHEPSAPDNKQFYGASAGEKAVDAVEQEKTAREEDGKDRFARTRAAAAPADKNLKAESKIAGYVQDERGDAQNLGKIFAPGINTGSERKLEYNLSVAYQVESIRAARAFFTQWIPRYGFMLHETATGSQNGYLSLQVRVRSANLYAALHDLDQVGNLTSENVTVTDHTENLVHQQMLAAREDIRQRRRLIANQSTSTAAKSWEATENLLSASEDKQISTRMEEWRIADRTGWATINITLSLPYVPAPAAVEVPQFRNAFVGLLNLLLQLVYAAIYIVPLVLVGYVVYRGVVRLVPAVRRLLPRPG